MKHTFFVGQSIIEGKIIHFFQVQCDTVARKIRLLVDRSLWGNRPKDILHPRCGPAGQPQEMRMEFSEVGRLERGIKGGHPRWADYMTIGWGIDMIEGECFRPRSWLTMLRYEHQSGKHEETYSRERRRLCWIQRFGTSEVNKFIHTTDNSPVPVHPRATSLRLLRHVPSSRHVRIVPIKGNNLGGCGVQA
jgi:hypothetical protein